MTPRESIRQPQPGSHQHIGTLQRELRDTVERYELVFKATHDVLYDLNLLTGTVTWNSALEAQFGYSKNEPAGTLEWWVAHIHPDDALEVEKNLAEWFSSSNSTWQSEYRFRRADGSYSYVLDRGFITRDTRGGPMRIIGSLLDVTRQRELDRAKDEFISLVSHQLRTPLTTIRVYGEMFADGLLGKVTKRQAGYIARMTDASIRLIKLVNDILDVSRAELGHYTVKRHLANANQLVQTCIEQVTPLASIKGVTIHFTPNPACNVVHLDTTILVQVLDNLLVNAIRYTPAERGHVVVSCRRDGDELFFTVTDNGIGIPKSEQKHIFKRFYRAHNAVNIEENGNGLGLYLVHALMHTVGGKVWFESSYSKGTTFYVSMPAV